MQTDMINLKVRTESADVSLDLPLLSKKTRSLRQILENQRKASTVSGFSKDIRKATTGHLAYPLLLEGLHTTSFWNPPPNMRTKR